MMLQRKLHALDKEDIYFAQFSKNITSQCGEDGILEELFRLLPLSEPYPFCVDIGAWDGKHLSNTYSLLQEKNWGGLLVEANSERCAEAQDLYRDNTKVTCLSSLVALTGENALSDILARQNVKEDFDFLCIDVDGADYHLWKSITQPVASSYSSSIDCSSSNPVHFRPKVVCIEFNPSIPHDVFFVQIPDTTVHQGSSLLAMQELGYELGYVLIAVTAFNGIFLRSDLMTFMPPNVQFPQELYRIHVPHMTTAMFQTYDGELKYVGVKKLLWHNLALNPQTLQILPIKQRVYPFAPPSTLENAKGLNKKTTQHQHQQPNTIWTKDAILNHPIASLSDFSSLCRVAQQISATQPIIAEKLFEFLHDKMPDVTMLVTGDSQNSRLQFSQSAREILQFIDCLLSLVDKLQSQNIHVYVDQFLSPLMSLYSSLDTALCFVAGIHSMKRRDTSDESDDGADDVFCEVMFLRCAAEQKYLQCLWRHCTYSSNFNKICSADDEEVDMKEQIKKRKSQLIIPRVKVLSQFVRMTTQFLVCMEKENDSNSGEKIIVEKEEESCATTTKCSVLISWIEDWKKKLAHLH